MADAGGPVDRLPRHRRLQIDDLALGAAAFDPPAVQGAMPALS
jgi:hypothetical protein